MRARAASSSVVSADGSGVHRRRCTLRRRAAKHQVFFCVCAVFICVCARSLSLSGRTELGFASLTTISSNGSLPGPSALRLRGGFKAFWGEKYIAGFGCQEDRAFGVSEAAPG
jgi:hypothetical protein